MVIPEESARDYLGRDGPGAGVQESVNCNTDPKSDCKSAPIRCNALERTVKVGWNFSPPGVQVETRRYSLLPFLARMRGSGECEYIRRPTSVRTTAYAKDRRDQ